MYLSVKKTNYVKLGNEKHATKCVSQGCNGYAVCELLSSDLYEVHDSYMLCDLCAERLGKQLIKVSNEN